MCVWMSVCMCVWMSVCLQVGMHIGLQCPKRPEECTECPGAGVIDKCETLDVGAMNRIKVLWKNNLLFQRCPLTIEPSLQSPMPHHLHV